MKLSKLKLLVSNDFIKPKLSDLKIGDLIYFIDGTDTKRYCIINRIEKITPENKTKFYGGWYPDKKNAIRNNYDGGFMCLEHIFKVV